MSFDRPGIIIGAGRSGTNMLRDLLVGLPEFATWPCDEINYIWRHGNRSFDTDEFTRDMASNSIKQFIRNKFAQLEKKNPGATIIEKTCANSLRCEFVHEIFPDAKFVHIVRDGRDVAASAALRWNAQLDIGYILKKARFVPASDLPWYAVSYLKARLFRLFSGQERLSTWGPKYTGMKEALIENDLPVACAIQWQACVKAAMEQLDSLPSAQVLTVHYEKFARDPILELKRVSVFLGATPEHEKLEQLSKKVSAKSVGNWESKLSKEHAENIEKHCGATLRQLGYIV